MVPVCGGLEWRFQFEISVLQWSLAEPEAGFWCVEHCGGVVTGMCEVSEREGGGVMGKGDAQPLGLGQQHGDEKK